MILKKDVDLKLFDGKSAPKSFLRDIKSVFQFTNDQIKKYISFLFEYDFKDGDPLEMSTLVTESLGTELRLDPDTMASGFRSLGFLMEKVSRGDISADDLFRDMENLGLDQENLSKIKIISDSVVRFPQFYELSDIYHEKIKLIKSGPIPLIFSLEYSIDFRPVMYKEKIVDFLPIYYLIIRTVNDKEQKLQVSPFQLECLIKDLEKIRDQGKDLKKKVKKMGHE